MVLPDWIEQSTPLNRVLAATGNVAVATARKAERTQFVILEEPRSGYPVAPAEFVVEANPDDVELRRAS
jgi:hypothetical protein